MIRIRPKLDAGAAPRAIYSEDAEGFVFRSTWTSCGIPYKCLPDPQMADNSSKVAKGLIYASATDYSIRCRYSRAIGWARPKLECLTKIQEEELGLGGPYC